MTYESLILLFAALIPLPFVAPWNYVVKIVLLVMIYFGFKRTDLSQKNLIFLSAILFVLFMYFGHAFSLIYHKTVAYLMTGTLQEGLHFYGVKQTVREAGHIPFSTFANRISGSQLGVLIAFIGYIVLVIRHRAFILALPLIGIGVFALWGGLRFTVYAVPVAAMSAVYLFFVIGEFFKNTKAQYVFAVLATGAMIYPNITHIIGYKVPTVFKSAEVKDLVKLDEISDTKDYTLTWWDYGYPIWFYSDTNTLIDGGKHNNDNFIISTIMQTTSPELAARLSRLAVETYVDSNYSVVANTLFKNGQPDQKDPNEVLAAIENGIYPIPKKTRDVYLYMPYRMMGIFPTVALFGNLDLITGKPKRKMRFNVTRAVKNAQGKLWLANGIIFDGKKGELIIQNKHVPLKSFVVAQFQRGGKTRIQTQPYHLDGDWVVVFLKSYGRFVIMDTETFRSMYVQMFMLGKYDKKLFEPVVVSPYARIYKLKI
jgi:dolichyl-diphosphooligosaccharide--protein glycosyltransferase/undecaprenyl-diphosphooligosaccharide--protein glycosyltransferase